MFDVFVSFKNLDPTTGQPTRDSQIASQLYAELTAAGISTFFSNVEVQRSSDARWGKLIDDALQEAKVIIVVGTRLEYIKSYWVEYEWRYFSEQIHCGVKKQIITVLEELSPHTLPPAFTQTQSYSSLNIKAAVNKVLNILGKSPAVLKNTAVSQDAAVKSVGTTPIRAGEYIKFGRYPQNGSEPEPIEWLVLSAGNGRALVISKYALDSVKYDETYSDVTWERCTLRSWLNKEFICRAFTSEEQGKVLNTYIDNPNNPSYGTNGGMPTNDKLFCLSVEEATKYFSSDKERITVATKYAENDGEHRKFGFWWLRSPGYSNNNAACVHDDGLINRSGRNTGSSLVFVRPAFYIVL